MPTEPEHEEPLDSGKRDVDTEWVVAYEMLEFQKALDEAEESRR